MATFELHGSICSQCSAPAICHCPDRTTLLATMAAAIAAGLVSTMHPIDADVDAESVVEMSVDLAARILAEAEHRTTGGDLASVGVSARHPGCTGALR